MLRPVDLTGVFSRGVEQREGGEHELHWRVERSLTAVEEYTAVEYPSMRVRAVPVYLLVCKELI
jgi:hypothetical protein